MRARAVIGASFGDEGKGLVVDYLCATEGAGMVVRHSGGSNAGHTVVTPDGRRHVFGHVGAGAFCNVPTFLSQFFTVNPIMFWKELDELAKVGVTPIVYAHPNCLVTTFADMMINQRIEDKRGVARHGSTGVGVNETYERSQVSELKITMADLWNGYVGLADKLSAICGKYAEFRTGKPIDDSDKMIDAFIRGAAMFADRVAPLGIGQCRDPVFEGSQGLLLDQDNKEYFPHVTRTKTGIHNVKILCQQAGIDDIDAYYVSRTYLTRHGAGTLPSEDSSMRFEDKTNMLHPYQGALRFAPLDYWNTHKRCSTDSGGDYCLVLTHCDQLSAPGSAHLYAFGPTRDDVRNQRFIGP